MNFSTRDPGKMKDIFRWSRQPDFDSPSLIVGWQEDAGQLSPGVIEYVNEKLKGQSFCEIEPASFFSLGGVTIEDDIAQFPECKFYCGQRNDLVLSKGNEPRSERYKFLNAVLDLAQYYCKIEALYTVSGTISSITHCASRRILAVFNQRGLAEKLRSYGLQDMTWQGPPAISSFLLWAAKNRGIAGVSLWIEIPFYLARGRDYQAIKTALSFLDRRFKLHLDLAQFDEKSRNQNMKIEQLRQEDPDINRYINMLESKLSLSGEEQMELTRRVTEALEKMSD